MAVTFVNIKKCVQTANYFRRIKAFKTAFGENISYFVHNKSYRHAAIVQIQISPDGKVFMEDGLEILVPPRQLMTLVPNYFSKYSTLQYKSETLSESVPLSIWFQMTRPHASECFGVGNKYCSRHGG